MITLRINDYEKRTIENYAKIKGLSVSALIKEAIFEKIEDEIDLELYDLAMKEYHQNPKDTVTFDEAVHELGING